MSTHCDVIIIGAGTAGEACALRLTQGGKRVTLVEQDLIGGETAYWAAIPSTTLLGPANLRWRQQQAAGLPSAAPGWPSVVATQVAQQGRQDDPSRAAALRQAGITFVRGRARILGPGRVDAGFDVLMADDIVIATGSEPRIPTLPGLLKSGYWTNREATTASSQPESVIIVGGGAQAVELAEMFRLYGTEVTVLNRSDRLLRHEDAEVGELVEQHLRQKGIRVVQGGHAEHVARSADGSYTVTLAGGMRVHGQRLVIATGRQPRTEDLGLESVGAHVGERGVTVDAHCRAAEGVWAAGDVTGIARYTHVALYQARIVADALLGHPHPAYYTSVPRVLFIDPQVAATGLTLAETSDRELDVESITVALSTRPDHAAATGGLMRGALTLCADRTRKVLVGAWAVAPDASEWIHLAVLAVRAAIPLPVLRDTVEQFPMFSDPYIRALDQLEAKVG